jgi:serine/threonine-protein kinase
VLGNLLPKLELGTSRATSLAVEASFLAYSESDVEHDFVRMVSELRKGLRAPVPAGRWRRPRPSPPRPIRLVVVLDELDKLTSTTAGIQSLDEILLGLKNVLTNAGAHFVLVAGPDLYDRVAHDARQGGGVYESVFAWHAYVPCVWSGAGSLLGALVEEPATTDEAGAPLDHLAAYLAYRARGLPRRLLQSVNELTAWTGDRPFLELDDVDRRRIALYCRLELALRRHLGMGDATERTTTLDEDRRRLAAYLVLEWVTGSGGRVFEVADVALHVAAAPLGHGVQLDPVAIAELLRDLVGEGVLRELAPDTPGVTYVGTAVASTPAFALHDDVLDELRALAGVPSGVLLARLHQALPPIAPPDAWGVGIPGTPPARPPAPPPPAPPPLPAGTFPPQPIRPTITVVPTADDATTYRPAAPPPAPETPLGPALDANRYEFGRRLGSGATGSVYEATDKLLGRAVAIKMIERYSALTDPIVRGRFQREMALAGRLVHPGIVQTFGVLERDDGRVGVVMELVPGPTLADVALPLPAGLAVRWSRHLCATLQYLAEQGVARIDLKPSNVILRDGEDPVVVDLGIAKRETGARSTITAVGELVGTPAYMAPEQINGGPLDIRADIFSLGVILFELLGGTEFRPPLDNLMESLRRTIADDVPVERLAVSADLRRVLARAVARDPDQRFTQPHQLDEALAATPEGAEPTSARATIDR